MVIKHAKHSLGQTLVEFALILPTLMLIIMGLFEFGRMMQVWLTLQYSAQAAARFASTGQEWVDHSVDPWDTARLNAVKNEARTNATTLDIQDDVGPSDPGYWSVKVYASDSSVVGHEYPGGPNARVSVDIIYNYPLITPIATMIAPYVTLRAHSEMINERFRHPGYGTPPGVLPPTIPPTPTPTKTSPAATATRTPTITGTIPTRTPTFTATITNTRAPTSTFRPTRTPTPSDTPTPSNTPTRTPTPTKTRTPTKTPKV